MTSLEKLCALIEWALLLAFIAAIVLLMVPLGE